MSRSDYYKTFCCHTSSLNLNLLALYCFGFWIRLIIESLRYLQNISHCNIRICL